MPSEDGIDYVRRHNIVNLFDGLVVHLLAVRPADPVKSLLEFAEKRWGSNKGRASWAVDDADPITPPLGVYGGDGASRRRRSLALLRGRQAGVEETQETSPDGGVTRRSITSDTVEGHHLAVMTTGFDIQMVSDVCDDDWLSPPAADLAPRAVQERLSALRRLEVADTSAEREMTKCQEDGETAVDLSNLALQEMPDTVVSLQHLVKLDVSNNRLTELPPELCLLTELEWLSAKSNALAKLPSSLSKLDRLSSCFLDHNVLTELPASFSDFKSLTTMGLDWNDLSAIPVQLLKARSLRRLYVVENPGIDTFPPLELLRECGDVEVHTDNLPSMVRQWESLASQVKVSVVWNLVFPDRVVDYLFLGSLRSAQLPRVYTELGITQVASIGRELTVVLSQGMDQIQLNVDDLAETDLTPLLSQAHEFIQKSIDARTGCLVHCFKGQSRSATVVITFLMQKWRWGRDKATAFVRERRPCINPNPGFMDLMLRYEKQLGL